MKTSYALPRIAAFALLLFALPAVAQEAPDALVKRVSGETVQAIKADPKIAAGDPARISEVIEQKLLPNFDFTRMTALAMGATGGRRRPSSRSS